jgi:hypothetical protein
LILLFKLNPRGLAYLISITAPLFLGTAALSDPCNCAPFQLQYYRETYSSPDACWAGEQRMRGACRQCCTAAFGPGGCDQEKAKINVDWVFDDAGAQATYRQQLNRGKSAFEAVVGAQAHNPPVQNALRQCQTWVESYLASRGAPGGGITLSNRALGPSDCRCISVLRAGNVDTQGRQAYRGVNACDGMNVSVRFIGDILSLTPSLELSSWVQAGLLGANQERIVWAPAWKIVSIKALGLKNAAGSFTCQF